MRADDFRSTEITRHGAYVSLNVPPQRAEHAARAAVPALARHLDLCNEFESEGGDPSRAIAFLRRVSTTPGDLADDRLESADAIVHVAAASAGPVAEFCADLTRLLAPLQPVVLGGIVRPPRYTGDAMHDFAYAERVLQQPGTAMPNAFLVPMNKSAGWWEKDWMERHTYFLPRYDSSGRRVAEGHALAAAAGIPCLLRRTYRCPTEPAPPGTYDFVNYFECADADVPTFHQVCAALRDVAKNPEWRFVQEGPTWHGRRVASWAELFA